MTINEEHRKLNGKLREENIGLKLIIKEIIDTFKEIEDNRISLMNKLNNWKESYE